jgi:hypothetical protein
VFAEDTAALESTVDEAVVKKTMEAGSPHDLLCLKKALDRDIALTKLKIRDEEEKVLGYMVRPLPRAPGLMTGIRDETEE